MLRVAVPVGNRTIRFGAEQSGLRPAVRDQWPRNWRYADSGQPTLWPNLYAGLGVCRFRAITVLGLHSKQWDRFDRLCEFAREFDYGERAGFLVTSVHAESFWGTALFYFEANVPVTPSGQYFLEPVLLAGDDTAALSGFYDYSGGTLFFSGQPSTIGLDLWFREGYIVPEPSVAWLGLVGGVAAVWLRHRRAPAG